MSVRKWWDADPLGDLADPYGIDPQDDDLADLVETRFHHDLNPHRRHEPDQESVAEVEAHSADSDSPGVIVLGGTTGSTDAAHGTTFTSRGLVDSGRERAPNGRPTERNNHNMRTRITTSAHALNYVRDRVNGGWELRPRRTEMGMGWDQNNASGNRTPNDPEEVSTWMYNSASDEVAATSCINARQGQAESPLVPPQVDSPLFPPVGEVCSISAPAALLKTEDHVHGLSVATSSEKVQLLTAASAPGFLASVGASVDSEWSDSATTPLSPPQASTALSSAYYHSPGRKRVISRRLPAAPGGATTSPQVGLLFSGGKSKIADSSSPVLGASVWGPADADHAAAGGGPSLGKDETPSTSRSLRRGHDESSAGQEDACSPSCSKIPRLSTPSPVLLRGVVGRRLNLDGGPYPGSNVFLHGQAPYHGERNANPVYNDRPSSTEQ